ncbi:hypothetical protein ACLOJK_011726 [Asimina triloba]
MHLLLLHDALAQQAPLRPPLLPFTVPTGDYLIAHRTRPTASPQRSDQSLVVTTLDLHRPVILCSSSLLPCFFLIFDMAKTHHRRLSVVMLAAVLLLHLRRKIHHRSSPLPWVENSTIVANLHGCARPHAVIAVRPPRSSFLDLKMSASLRFSRLAPKTKNLIVAGSLTGFVLGVYFYTMRAVGGTDELQVAIDKFEEERSKSE